jgi:DNA primase
MDEVAEIKSRLEITEVVGAYLPLKQAGRNLKAPCPFHQEKTASFMVSPDKGIYHCFGCGEGGDIFSFVEKMEGLDFRGALELLARKAGVELKAKKGENKEAARLRDRLIEAHALAVKYYQASLVQNKKAAEYAVRKRGLTKETIGEFGIGYAPDSWNALSDFLAKRGFTTKELLQAGLVGQKEGRTSVYDLFRARLMFPISDREGRPVGFTGRVLDDGVPKYLNTPQTAIYDKSHVIFGLHLAKEAIRAKDEAVLVEGNMDVVASHQAGVKQVVAASGTALTIDQLRVISKLTKNVKLAFDSDRAGLAATERAILMGQQLGLVLRIIDTGEAKDPDELIKEGIGKWEAAIKNAKYIVDYLFDVFERDYDLKSAIGKRGYADRLASTLKRLGDPVEQDHYVKLLAEKIQTSEDAIREKIRRAGEEPNSKQEAESQPAPVRRAVIQADSKPGSVQLLEEALLSLALLDESTRLALADLDEEVFSGEQRKRVFQMLRTDDPTPKPLTEDEDYVKILLLRGEQEFTELAPADRSFEAFGLARRLQMVSNKLNKQRLSEQLREAEKSGDAQLVSTILKQYQALLEEEV